MSITGAAGADVVRVVNGVTVRFRKPTRDQVGGQIAVWAAQDKANLLALCEQAKVEPEYTFGVLREHDSRSRLVSYGLTCLFELARASDVVRAAYVASGGRGPDFDTLDIPPDDLVKLAAELWGMNLEAKGPQKKSEANPTGSSTTPSSGTGTDASPAL